MKEFSQLKFYKFNFKQLKAFRYKRGIRLLAHMYELGQN